MYDRNLGKFVSIDYRDGQGHLQTAKGILLEVTDSNQLVVQTKDKELNWIIHIDSVINFSAKPLKVKGDRNSN